MNNGDSKIRVLLVDDHTIVREGIRSCLAAYENVEIAGEASNGHEAISQARDLAVDVVVMDITMPLMSGLEATERLGREVPAAKVLILTVHDNVEYVHKIVNCGARGYVLKDASPEELAHAIEAVNAGRSFFSREISGALVDFCMRKPREENAATLSRRELQVLKLVAQGFSTKEIAADLNITFRTVETHREHIMRKLGIHNVAGLTRYAISKQIIGV